MTDLSTISVVLPSLDPDEKLVAVVDGLLEYGFQDIILVNDGSKPENVHYFSPQMMHLQSSDNSAEIIHMQPPGRLRISLFQHAMDILFALFLCQSFQISPVFLILTLLVKGIPL